MEETFSLKGGNYAVAEETQEIRVASPRKREGFRFRFTRKSTLYRNLPPHGSSFNGVHQCARWECRKPAERYRFMARVNSLFRNFRSFRGTLWKVTRNSANSWTAMMLVTISIRIGNIFLVYFFWSIFFILKHCIRFVVNYSFICSLNRLLLKNNSI